MKKKNTLTNILPQREKQHVEIAAVEAETAPTPMEMMPLLHYYSVEEQGVAVAALPREMQHWLPRGSFVAADKTKAVIAADIAAAVTVVDAMAMVVAVAAVAAASSPRTRMDCHRLRSPMPQKDFAAGVTVAAAAPPVAVARLLSRYRTHRRD
jgi:hypothetical protein